MDTIKRHPTCLDCILHYVCRCLRITQEDVAGLLAARDDIRTLKDLRRETGAGEGCMACHGKLRAALEEYAYSSSSEPICSVR